MAPTLAPGDFVAEVAALRDLASAVAAKLAAASTRMRTLGRERAVLRLLGVSGTDREGRPLAAEVADRYAGGRPGLLASGIALPFCLALQEYDSDPQQLALDVASGAVDLSLEAELLASPDRRASAVGHLQTLLAGAVERIDANRTARAELFALLGDRELPWIGTTLLESSAHGGALEAANLVRGGADLIRVEVPVGRELALRLGELGQDVAAWHADRDDEPDPAPAGSQRGLAHVRDALDRAAAERGAYVRLATVPTALAGPEGAIVAAFERVDLLELDPMGEIVGTGVDPVRALADFAFAARVARRAGTILLLPAGPLVVAPDMDSGVNSDPATRAGRALGLQLLAVGLAARHGLDPGSLVIGALPAWLADETYAAARAAAEVAIRRVLMKDHPLAFLEPAGHDGEGRWAAIVAAVAPGSGTGLVLRRAAAGMMFDQVAAGNRASAEVARQLDDALGSRTLDGEARRHAEGSLAAAARTLEQLGADGWAAITGATAERTGWGRLGGDAVALADDPIDSVERALA
ncbi:MAG: Lys-AminoMut protein [Chloroflexi bacterium]|nr:Lys-AminoMut protein [Chloroflexota bacterium]